MAELERSSCGHCGRWLEQSANAAFNVRKQPTQCLDSALIDVNPTTHLYKSHVEKHLIESPHQDQMDYIGEVKLGTPGQTFRIIFDTGSADFWVPSIQCLVGCNDHRKYDRSHSSSHVSDGTAVSIKYGSGEVNGVLSSDTLHLGNGAVPAQPFAEITHASQGIFRPEPFDGEIGRDVPFDGIIGLAYPKVSSLKVKPVFDAIMEHNLVPQSVFSFYLGSSSSGRPAGELVLGGINHEHFRGNMHYVSVTKKRHWEFKMDRVQAGGDKRFCVGGCRTVVDSGSSFIEGPGEEIDRISRVIGAQKTDRKISQYLVDCKKVSKLPKLVFTIGGRQHTLKGADYIVKLLTSDNRVRCYAGFGTTDDYGTKKPLWILGQVFMRKFYTVFDRHADRIGFAEAR
ncbi:cathepsin D-like [Dermacentor variabilis]|uniref:cathepsin D-like n=1 Tax=Dermacentor variabilis TaxID=34621 RepID=UPI003F5C2AA6